MTKGRKPLPTHLKVIAGNRGKRPLNTSEPMPINGIGEPIAELCDDAKLEWQRLAAEMQEIGILTALDRAVFGCYCQSYGRWATAQRELNALGAIDPQSALTSRTGNGNLIQNPLVSICNKAARDMHRYAAELGMTPSARSRIVVSKTNDVNDPASRFLD